MKAIVDIGYRIKKIDDLLCKKADTQMQEMGVTFSQHHILVYLIHCQDHTASLKQMEHQFCVSQATMAGIARRMEEKKVISSFTLPDDRRVKMVRLTDKGIDICEKSRKLMEKSEMKMRSLYSVEEMAAFDKYLDRLLDTLMGKENENV